jgi:flagellar hook-associated protein 2
LTSNAGTATIATKSGETYAQLATAINNATVASVSYSTTPQLDKDLNPIPLTSSSLLSVGSVTTINDTATGGTFTFTGTGTNTVGDLNNAIAAAVTAGTLSPTVSSAISNGNEVIKEGATNTGITVSTTDTNLGAMVTTTGASASLGLTATAGSDTNGTNLTVASNVPAAGSDGTVPATPTFTLNEPAFGFTQAAAAANASLTVDGVPVQSATNQVTGAIPGVTLNLLGASSGSPIDITVAPDATQISTAINQFVTDYNTALNLVNTQFNDTSSTNSSGTTTTAQGVLASDPIVVQLQGVLEQAAAYSYTPASGTTTVSTLSDLGITTNDDGSLAVDSTTLNNALVNNASDVATFLQGSALNGFANSVYNAVNNFTSPANGAFKVDLSSIASESASVTSEINDFETGYIAAQQKILTADYTQAETALQSLPTEMEQLNAELGLTPTGNNNG